MAKAISADAIVDEQVERKDRETKDAETQTAEVAESVCLASITDPALAKTFMEMRESVDYVRNNLEKLSNAQLTAAELLDCQKSMLNEVLKISELIETTNGATNGCVDAAQLPKSEKTEEKEEKKNERSASAEDSIKKAYSELLKAKIEFDTSFIEFDSAFNQRAASSADFRSLQQFCANSDLLLGQRSNAAPPKISKRKRSVWTLSSSGVGADDGEESKGKKQLRRSPRLMPQD